MASGCPDCPSGCRNPPFPPSGSPYNLTGPLSPPPPLSDFRLCPAPTLDRHRSAPQPHGADGGCRPSCWRGLVLTACTPAPPGLEDVYDPVVRPEYAPLLTELTDAPRIDMEVWYQPTRNHLEGRMRVSGINHTGDTWTQLVFRLYPNLTHVGGGMVIKRGTVRNALVPFKLAADDTAAVFLLPNEEWIRPGRPFEIELVWSLDLPVFPEVSSVYVPFGQMLGFHAAPWFYPVLAHYVPTSPAAPGHWWLETAPAFADILYSPASFFRVQLWMPEGYPPVTPGVERERTALIHNCPPPGALVRVHGGGPGRPVPTTWRPGSANPFR